MEEYKLKWICSKCGKPLGKHNGLDDCPLSIGGFNYGVKFKKSRPQDAKVAAKPTHNTASQKCPHCGKKIFIAVTSGVA